jgi:hypothetical protein
MTSRVVSVPIFYATESGIVYHPVSEDHVENGNGVGHHHHHHDVDESRVRLANILKSRKQQQTHRNKLAQQHDDVVGKEQEKDNQEEDADGAAREEESGDYDEEEGVVVDASNEDNNPTTTTTNLAIRRIELSQKHGGAAQDVMNRKQQKINALLARSARASSNKNGSTSKAIASQYAHKQAPADNAAARAVVHHTGSHYHMAGGVQFQRGVRVKGVISRHSKQGAKLQAARTSERNSSSAREDARGQRSEGAGRSTGKTKKSKEK